MASNAGFRFNGPPQVNRHGRPRFAANLAIVVSLVFAFGAIAWPRPNAVDAATVRPMPPAPAQPEVEPAPEPESAAIEDVFRAPKTPTPPPIERR